MPKNKHTGKADRRRKTDAEVLDYQLSQAKEQAQGVKKGKQRAVDPPDAAEAEGSAKTPSPLAALSGLGTLTLDSPRDAPATPVDSPTTSFQSPSPGQTPSAPPLAPKARGASKSSAGKSTSQPPVTASAEHAQPRAQACSGQRFGPSALLVTHRRRAIPKAMATGLLCWSRTRLNW